MQKKQDLTSLEQLIERLDQLAQDSDRLSMDAILDIVGRRSFGPLVLVAGLITLAPIVGDIPGVPTVVGVLVLVVSVQLLLQRDHIWLPDWLLKRSIASTRVLKALKWTRRPARFVDRMLNPRLALFAEGPVIYVIVVISMVIAAAMPVMEVVPFSANFAGAALTAFGLALIARDGLLALIAVGLTVATGVFIVSQLM